MLLHGNDLGLSISYPTLLTGIPSLDTAFFTSRWRRQREDLRQTAALHWKETLWGERDDQRWGEKGFRTDREASGPLESTDHWTPQRRSRAREYLKHRWSRLFLTGKDSESRCFKNRFTSYAEKSNTLLKLLGYFNQKLNWWVQFTQKMLTFDPTIG